MRGSRRQTAALTMGVFHPDFSTPASSASTGCACRSSPALTAGIIWVSGPLLGVVHDLIAARIWGIALSGGRLGSGRPGR
jgi:hypothetical protein